MPVRAYLTRYPHVMNYDASLRRLFRESWDVVHCWEEPYVLAGHQLSRWVKSARRLVFYSFQNISKNYPPPFNWLERLVDAEGRWMDRGGPYGGGSLGQRAGYADKPRRVIPLGVDVEQFLPNPAARAAIRKSLGWSGNGPPVIGFLGRFVRRKDWSTLLSTRCGLGAVAGGTGGRRATRRGLAILGRTVDG